MPIPYLKKAEKYLVISKTGHTSSMSELIQKLIEHRPRLIAFYGKDCSLLEDICDEEIVGDGREPLLEITTTSHPDETLENVINLVELWDIKEIGKIFELVEL
jgi:predicted CopG family antitoxin